MLIAADDAAQFLTAYKAMLTRAAGRTLSDFPAFVRARDAFFENSALLERPPTCDPQLLDALRCACYGRFLICRHMARATEMIGPDDRAYRVRGLTTELRDLVDSWVVADTAVMQFKGTWICDGLIKSSNIHIGPNMRKDLLAKIRNG